MSASLAGACHKHGGGRIEIGMIPALWELELAFTCLLQDRRFASGQLVQAEARSVAEKHQIA
jgi:hypothetical protein